MKPKAFWQRQRVGMNFTLVRSKFHFPVSCSVCSCFYIAAFLLSLPPPSLPPPSLPPPSLPPPSLPLPSLPLPPSSLPPILRDLQALTQDLGIRMKTHRKGSDASDKRAAFRDIEEQTIALGKKTRNEVSR